MICLNIKARLLARWYSRSPMDSHFSEKINILSNYIQRVFWQIWKITLDTFALITGEKHLTCSSGPPMVTKSGLIKILDSHFLNPGKKLDQSETSANPDEDLIITKT